MERGDELRADITPITERSQTLMVSTAAERTVAVDFLKDIKSMQKRVTEFFSPMKDAVHKAWKAVTEKESTMLSPLKDVESVVKQRVLVFDDTEERVRLDKQRKLQADADENARKEKERLEREAAKLKTPELREQRMAQAAAVTAPVVIVATITVKQKGESTRKTWKARLVDKNALVKSATSSDLAMSILIFDQAAANKLAISTKGAVAVPGVEWYEETSLAIGGVK